MISSFSIIPKPVELLPRGDFFILAPDTVIVTDSQNQKNGAYLRDFLTPAMGAPLSVQGKTDQIENIITLKIDPALADLTEEGYRLIVSETAVFIAGSTPKGIFYGIQTLRQLLPIEIEGREEVVGMQWQIPCCEIVDYPRFSWRGYMLDEGRHFQGKETVLRVLDLMALLKLNVFHWHLTEDQGWRIEIKRYPKLTEIGSQRAGTAQSFNDMRKKQHDGIPHGGFYTQDEIREIVSYAAERQITIVPEIEIPGHCRAAVAAYPELSCFKDKVKVATGPGIYKDIYCAGKETTFEFLQNVLDEILLLFPSPVIHLGGDEAPKARWKRCSACQQRIQTEGLKNEHELQTYFIHRISEYLKSKGRTVMGWNEILDAFRHTKKTLKQQAEQGLSYQTFEAAELHTDQSNESDESIIQYWVRNKRGLLAALRAGQKVVNSAYLDTYLDHSYSLTPLSRAYHFDPILKGADEKAAQNILGLEAPMWTEWVPNQNRLEYQTYPRLTAFAEVGWTPKPLRNYSDFRQRLMIFNKRLDYFDIQYAPEVDWDPPWYQRFFGIFTIAQPQTRTRPQN